MHPDNLYILNRQCTDIFAPTHKNNSALENDPVYE